MAFNGTTMGLFMTGAVLFCIGEIMKLSCDQSRKQSPARFFDLSFLLSQRDALAKNEDWKAFVQSLGQGTNQLVNAITSFNKNTPKALNMSKRDVNELLAIEKWKEATLTTLVQSVGMALWTPLFYVQVDPCLKTCEKSVLGWAARFLPFFGLMDDELETDALASSDCWRVGGQCHRGAQRAPLCHVSETKLAAKPASRSDDAGRRAPRLCPPLRPQDRSQPLGNVMPEAGGEEEGPQADRAAIQAS